MAKMRAVDAAVPQMNFDMDYCVQLSFDNINATDVEGYGVDQVTVAEGLGCKALRVRKPEELVLAFAQVRALMHEHRVPVVIECILERVTNIAMCTEIDAVREWEPILDIAAEPA